MPSRGLEPLAGVVSLRMLVWQLEAIGLETGTAMVACLVAWSLVSAVRALRRSRG
jgi:hypothetical protein